MGVSLPSYRVGGVRIDGVRVDGAYLRSAAPPGRRRGSNAPPLRKSRLVKRLVRDSSRLLGDGDAVDPLNQATANRIVI